MMGFHAISAHPISSIEEAEPIFGAAATFIGRATLTALPLAGLFLGSVAFTGNATVEAYPIAVRPLSVRFEAGASFEVGRPILLLGGATAFFGSATLTADLEFRLYAATEEFITRPDDARPNFPFMGTLQKAVRFDRSILNSGTVGQVTTGWGEMELINAEADYDYLVENYSIDGRRVVLRVGEVANGYDSFFSIFELTAKGWHVAEDVLRIDLRDHGYKLEVPVQSELYGGAGNLDGDESLKGKRKPLPLGECANVTPQPLVMSPAVPLYQVSGGAVEAITAVRDRAIALTPATVMVYATPELLLAATDGPQGGGADIEAGEFAVCLNPAFIRLGGTPIGTVTCDVKGAKFGGVYAETTIDIIRGLVLEADPAAKFDAPAMAIANARQPAVVGYFLPTGSELQTADVIADLIGGIGGWAGHRRNGAFSASIFELPVAPPSASYTDIEIEDIVREKLPDGMEPPPWRYRVTWGRNWTVQTDLVEDAGAGLTAERIAFLKEGYRLATSSEAQAAVIKGNHPLAQDPAEKQAYFRDEVPATEEANRQLGIFSKKLSLYRVKMHGIPFIHDVGDVIHVTYRRWDLRTGRLLRIVSISEDTDTNTTEILGLG